jgi:hypothetical protein
LGIILIRPIYLKLINKNNRSKDGFQLLINENVEILKEINQEFLLIKVQGKEFRAYRPEGYNKQKKYKLKNFNRTTAVLIQNKGDKNG